MSQIFYEPIDLSDLAMSASCIVIGTIESRDQREHAFEDISPFSFTVYRIRVEKVLKGPLSEGELIDVEGANTQAELSMHEMYEREDILESPIYLQYNKDRTPKHAIFFFNDGLLVPFAFAAEGAWEEVDNVDQVRALV